MQSNNDPQRQTRGSEYAKAWASERAKAFGHAVNKHRVRLGLTMAQLSELTAQVGYPITRGTIAKIESNSRNSKMDLTELIALSAALSVPPALLVFPQFPEGHDIPIAGIRTTTEDAVNWFHGKSTVLSPRETRNNKGTNLIVLVEARKQLAKDYVAHARATAAIKGVPVEDAVDYDELQASLNQINSEIAQLRAELNGEG